MHSGSVAARLWLSIVVGLVTGSAGAEGFAVGRFDPSPVGGSWFANDSLSGRAKDVRVGGTFDWSQNGLVIRGDKGSAVAVEKSRALLHLGGSWTLLEWLRVHANLPTALFTAGNTTSLGGQPIANIRGTGIGDLRLGADVLAFGDLGGQLALTVGFQAYLPTGKQEAYLSDGSARLRLRVNAAGQVGALRWATSVNLHLRPDANDLADVVRSPRGAELGFSAAVGYSFVNEALVIGPELWGSTSLRDAFSAKSSPIEALLGLHTLRSDLRFGIAAGVGLGESAGSPSSRVLLSLGWEPGSSGVSSKPSSLALPEESVGLRRTECGTLLHPKPCFDRDGDGIPDRVDACPDLAGTHAAKAEEHGCPPDRDKDGIPDVRDACPDEKGVASRDPKRDGCPGEPDADADGIPDRVDACKDRLGIPSDVARFHGCPSDMDDDGIPNREDACPETAGVPNTDLKKHGCPASASIVARDLRLVEQVLFRTGSADILKESYPTLDLLGRVLKDHLDIRLLEVGGHTDNRGVAAANLVLSRRRAEAIVAELIKRGVAKVRLVAKGYGDTQPVDSNATEEGRNKNRRVVFLILDTPK